MKEILLPQNEIEFNDFANTVFTEFSIPQTDRNIKYLAQAIYDLSDLVAFASIKTFADRVRQSIAKDLALRIIKKYETN